MTKYKTTLGHNWINVGTILSVNSGHKISLKDGSILGISKEKFNQWIESGWIVKMQELEFTEDEMYDFAIKYDGESCQRKAIDEWKQSR